MMSRSDSIVAPADSRTLAGQFAAPIVLEHSGGHVVDGTPPARETVARFLNEMADRRQHTNPLHPTGVVTP